MPYPTIFSQYSITDRIATQYINIKNEKILPDFDFSKGPKEVMGDLYFESCSIYSLKNFPKVYGSIRLDSCIIGENICLNEFGNEIDSLEINNCYFKNIDSLNYLPEKINGSLYISLKSKKKISFGKNIEFIKNNANINFNAEKEDVINIVNRTGNSVYLTGCYSLYEKEAFSDLVINYLINKKGKGFSIKFNSGEGDFLDVNNILSKRSSSIFADIFLNEWSLKRLISRPLSLILYNFFLSPYFIQRFLDTNPGEATLQIKEIKKILEERNVFDEIKFPDNNPKWKQIIFNLGDLGDFGL